MLSLDVSLRPRPGLPSGRVSGVGVRRELQQHGLARRAWLARNTVATENTEFASPGFEKQPIRRRAGIGHLVQRAA